MQGVEKSVAKGKEVIFLLVLEVGCIARNSKLMYFEAYTYSN
jgi:hypothetical protein